MHTGGCECGSVRFEVKNLRDTVTGCHCGQCRRVSGHFWASTMANKEDYRFLKDDGLTWFKSSDWAERGFCANCGSSLFYRMFDENHMSVGAGCLDDASGFTMGRHIFVKDKGDYYDIADDAPQIQKY
ncbi:MAG: GFA family protein [Cognatishimia sp.]|uniref:GFA family protein n=1 Tax=Cognatishimia sp. TaxID=2211648 RepID=UPI003B8DBC6B